MYIGTCTWPTWNPARKFGGVKGIFSELTALNAAAHLHARDEVDAKGERAHTRE